MMPIPILDLKAEYLTLHVEIDEAVHTVLRSGQFILGENLRKLEEEMAHFCRVPYAVGVASGTDALHLALRACGIGPGDEVLTSPFTFAATAEAICYTGARPVFADIDRETYILDPNHTEEVLKRKKGGPSRVTALLPVHLYGHPAPMRDFAALADRYHAALVEDCAQAIGAELHGQHVGSFGGAGGFSFYPTKNLGAYGDAGMVITRREAVAHRVRTLRAHGTVHHRHVHEEVGYNSRLDEIQAAILRVKLRHLGEWTARRREIAETYRENLTGLPLILPPTLAGGLAVYHQFTIRLKERDRLREHLERRGIGTGIYYPIPLHLTKAFAFLGYREGDFPQAEEAAAEILSLPLYPTLTDAQVQEIAQAVREFFAETSRGA